MYGERLYIQINMTWLGGVNWFLDYFLLPFFTLYTTGQCSFINFTTATLTSQWMPPLGNHYIQEPKLCTTESWLLTDVTNFHFTYPVLLYTQWRGWCPRCYLRSRCTVPHRPDWHSGWRDLLKEWCWCEGPLGGPCGLLWSRSHGAAADPSHCTPGSRSPRPEPRYSVAGSRN